MRRAMFVGLPVMLVSLTAIGAQQSNAIGKFDATFYSPIEITRSVTQRAVTSALSDADRANLLAARDVLGRFLRSLSKQNENPLDYLDPALRSNYRDGVALMSSVFNTEAVLKVEIFDFNITDEGRKIQFRYFLTETTEGMTCEHQRAITLQKTPAAWRISKFNEFDFGRK